MNAELQYPLTVQYCSACTMPLEYCEYSDNKACQKQLAECTQEYKPRPYVQLATSSYSVKLDPVVVKRQQARKIPAGRNAKSGGNTKIVTRDDKSKEATHIVGLDSFGINLKEACKIITKKFGTRCNVVPGTNELFIQGNFVCQLFDSLPEMFDAIGIRDIVDKGVRQVASSDDYEEDED